MGPNARLSPVVLNARVNIVANQIRPNRSGFDMLKCTEPSRHWANFFSDFVLVQNVVCPSPVIRGVRIHFELSNENTENPVPKTPPTRSHKHPRAIPRLNLTVYIVAYESDIVGGARRHSSSQRRFPMVSIRPTLGVHSSSQTLTIPL